MFSDLSFERIIAYACSEVICPAVKRENPRFAIIENRKHPDRAQERPQRIVHCNCRDDHLKHPLGFQDFVDWRRWPNQAFHHAKGQIRPQHVRVSRHFTLLDFCRDEIGIERGLPRVVVPEVSKRQIIYARMFADILDPLTNEVGRLAVIEGLVPPALTKIYDKQTALLRSWMGGRARVKFVLPEGVGHEAALPYLQDAEGVTGIDVEDHGSGDAVAITLQINPFRPRTLYASDKLYGHAGGLVPGHLEAYSHLLMP